MKKNWRFSLIILTASTLAGCASYPLPISEPSAKVKTKDSNGTEIEIKRLPDYQRGGLLPATRLDESKDNLKIYADWYRQKADDLHTSEYHASDFVFGGGVLAALGGLANSQGAAIAGAATASGASMISQRYQALVQSTNYDHAGDAMYCMYRVLYPLNQELVEISILSDVEHERVRKSLVSTINERIDEVRLKLRDVQGKIVLSSPDIKQLEDSIKSAQEKKGQVASEVAGFNLNSAITESRVKEKSIAPLRASIIDQRPSPSPSEIEYFNTHLPVIEEELSKCGAKF